MQRPPKYLPYSNNSHEDIVGGYNTSKLPGYETGTEECSVDQYQAGEITSKEVFQRYVLQMKPVLIRGLIDTWPALKDYNLDELNKTFGQVKFTVSSIPYANKFGGDFPQGIKNK